MTTIKQLLEEAEKKLKANNIDEPTAHAEFIVSYVLNKTRTYVRAFAQEIVPTKEEKLFKTILEQKLLGKPLAHIIGSAEFLGRIYNVSPTVLIPRPETEELVLKSKKMLSLVPPQTILDLCTGSGCIAISLAFLFPSAKVCGADISEEALKVAIQNARNLNILSKMNFIRSNIFKNISGSFDFIISNPPYIPTDVIKTLSPEVQCEPKIALDGGEDGLKIIKDIINKAPTFLNKNGLLALEIGCDQAQKVLKFFNKTIWKDITVEKDFAGIERFIFARRH